MNTSSIIPPLKRAIVRKTDSYKYGHFAMLPPKLERMSYYMESRGGKFPFSRFFGLQAIIKKHLIPLTGSYDIDYMAIDAKKHGVSFNKPGWNRIVKEHGGKLPLEIQAVPEGLDIPIGNVVMQITNTDTSMPWLSGFVETILEQVWGPTTLATDTAVIRQMRKNSLEKTSDSQASLEYSLHDFGYRGTPTDENAGTMGSAHLLNFSGTDTMAAIDEIRTYYNEDMAGYSIDAAEHSTIMAWPTEEDFWNNLIKNVLRSGKTVAAPIDTNDWRKTLREIIGGDLRHTIRASGGKLVVRPDSGIPWEVIPEILVILEEIFGTTVNSKGYKVLPSYIGVIFGDGLDIESIQRTENAIIEVGFSIENVVYGRGGGGLQKQMRDDMRWAIKLNAKDFGNGWVNVHKSTPGKESKPGRLALIHEDGVYKTIPENELKDRKNILRTVFNGDLLIDEDFDTIRKRARANEEVSTKIN